MLRCFQISADVPPSPTPGSTSHKLNRGDCPDPKPKKPSFPYRAAVGSLLYATNTRPDISYAVGVLCRFMQNPGLPHWKGVKRVFRYLAGSRSLRLRLGGKAPVLYCYTDADWCGEGGSSMDQCRSTSGSVICFADGVLHHSSKLQKVSDRSQ